MWYKVFYRGFVLIEADSEQEAIDTEDDSVSPYGEKEITHAVPLDRIEDNELWKLIEGL